MSAFLGDESYTNAKINFQFSAYLLLLLLQEYEENKTPESKFVKDLDRLDMVLQAFEYEKRDECPKKHQEFFDSTEGKFNHPLVIDLVEQIKLQRNGLVHDAEKQISTS